jgi:hypothetical protein
MNPSNSALLCFAVLAALAGCSGSGGGTGVVAGNDFLVTNTEPVNSGRVFLNDPIRVDFSNPIDFDTVDLNNFSFQVLDLTRNPVSEQVTGTFRIDTAPGDAEPGRRLLFVPRFPTNDTYDNGGFRSSRIYLAQLVGGDRHNGTVIRDRNGKSLFVPHTFEFSTAEGTSPAQLFRNPGPGGPRILRTGGVTISPEVPGDIALNKFGAPPVEVRLNFDQALNPASTNLPVAADTNPLFRDKAARGRVWLEYDDFESPPHRTVLANRLPDRSGQPVGSINVWIPADVELEANSVTGATLVLRPVGVLPNNAEVRVVVLETVEDIAGESNVGNPTYPVDSVVHRFRTRADYSQQFDAVVETFEATDSIDFDAAFPEPFAEVASGVISAGFEFEGARTSLDYEPLAAQVILNTAFTQVVPTVGLPFNVAGGVFKFKNVKINRGVTVQGTGPNPMVWVVTENFTVDGELSVNGGPGARVDTLNSANFAKAGGVAVCGGGAGGPGSPSGTARDPRGGTGAGPLNRVGLGGAGGRFACGGCYNGGGYDGMGGGSGGGGGTLATQGDPTYRQPIGVNGQFQQKLGIGGRGCSGGYQNRVQVLAGGEAAPAVFIDSRADNNFWGAGINLFTGLRVIGELAAPVGGGGGGGGGDTSYNGSCVLTDANFANDYSGGGGGAGGGVLIVKALGEIRIGATGRITANGGAGGGGEQAGACGEGGGGGGGAGGMVVLMSASGIKIQAHGNAAQNRYRYGSNFGNTADDNDYDFAISADGGVCTTGSFSSPTVRGKYPASGSPLMAGSTYDMKPLGAFGGMGIVQLMVPPGDNSDGTNTALDDKINFYFGPSYSLQATAQQKELLLAWRGIADAGGVFRDDDGTPIDLTPVGFEGDIRPSPTLLPVPFGALSRVRSKWIDTAASVRREIANPDGLPRGIATAGGAQAGPTYEFAGTFTQSGYVAFSGTAAEIAYPAVGAPMTIASMQADASFEGAPAFRVDVTSSTLGSVDDRYSQYDAQLRDSRGFELGSFRILSHVGNTLLLAPGIGGLPGAATSVQVRAKFFHVETNGTEGLGTTVTLGGNQIAPQSNLRIGFAFHTNPTPNQVLGNPGERFPSAPNSFQYDLTDAAFLQWVATNRPTYVQWDVTFDLDYTGQRGSENLLSAPRPALRSLRLPFRF